MKYLIIPDIHLKLTRLKRILAKLEDTVDHVICLGDYFDDYGAEIEAYRLMAEWLHENLNNKKYTFCFGNHDIQYAFPLTYAVEDYGFSREKQKAISSILKSSDWKKFHLFAWLDNNDDWICSHAGLHPSSLHPIYGWDRHHLLEIERRAIYRANNNNLDHLLMNGKARGGILPFGGVTWLDWNKEFEPVQGLNQIVGHSVDWNVRIKTGECSVNYCLDTCLDHVMIWNDGKIEIITVDNLDVS